MVEPEVSKASQTQAVALGLGSFLNHATLNQNVGGKRDLVAQCITNRTLRDTNVGEEF